MFRVSWPRKGDNTGFRTLWFNTREAAIRFYKTRDVAVVFDEKGDRISAADLR